MTKRSNNDKRHRTQRPKDQIMIKVASIKLLLKDCH